MDSRENNFDFIRLAAAVCVLFSHSFDLCGIPEREPFLNIVGRGTLGGLAVQVFFIISGFLIAQSFLNSKSAGRYLTKRTLRIWPGLAAVTLFCLFIIGPMNTVFPLGKYFSDSHTWQFLFGLFILPQKAKLPGVFNTNPMPNVDGSLWTLGIEFLLYIGVLLLGRARLLKLEFILIIFLAGLALSVHSKLDIKIPYTAFTIQNFIILSTFFFSGTLLFFLYRQGIFTNNRILFYLSLGIFFISFQTTHYIMVQFITIPVLVIWFALYGPKIFNNFGKYGDFSYGIYLYAFPVEQTYINFLLGKVGFLGITALSLATTLLLAFLSWHLIEKRALKIAHKRTGRFKLKAKILGQNVARIKSTPQCVSALPS